jgi:predicted phosphodiesterase
MKILILSDIHANITALNSVLEDASDFDETWCLGDIVGYGPDPNECIERIQALPNLSCIIGNHDAAALGTISVESFNMEAKLSILWLKSQLTPSNRAFLGSLQTQKKINDVLLVHGSPRSPIWEYMLDRYIANENFDCFDLNLCFVGHTHMPAVFEKLNSNGNVSVNILKPDETFQITTKSILNPGSVGQPRDHDRRSSYVFFDTENNTWQLKRIEYDYQSVQKRIRNAGLPIHHALRLAYGW